MAVKECLHLVHKEIFSIRIVIKALRSSVKRKDLFGKVNTELGMKGDGLSNIDVETRWPGTFIMIEMVYKVRFVLNAMNNASQNPRKSE